MDLPLLNYAEPRPHPGYYLWLLGWLVSPERDPIFNLASWPAVMIDRVSLLVITINRNIFPTDYGLLRTTVHILALYASC